MPRLRPRRARWQARRKAHSQASLPQGGSIKAPLLATLFLLLALAGCGAPPAEKQPEYGAFALKAIGPDGKIFLEKALPADGNSLLGIMKSSGVGVEYKEYAFGAFIESIAGAEPPEGSYYALYVDGNYSGKGVSELVPRAGQAVEFKAEKAQ